MKEILSRIDEFEYITTTIFPEDIILNVINIKINFPISSFNLFIFDSQSPVEEWPRCDCLIAFHSKGFPLEKTIEYAKLRKPYIINNLEAQFDIQDRRQVYKILEDKGIEIPRYVKIFQVRKSQGFKIINLHNFLGTQSLIGTIPLKTHWQKRMTMSK